MSWTDQELSEMAKKAEAGRAFTYDDSFWGEMEALLPAKKKSIWPYFWAIAVLIVGALTLYLAGPTKGVSTSHVAKTIPFEMNRFGNTNNLGLSLSSSQEKKVVGVDLDIQSQNVSPAISAYSAEKSAIKNPKILASTETNFGRKQKSGNTRNLEITEQIVPVINASSSYKNDLTQFNREALPQDVNKSAESEIVERLSFAPLSLLGFNPDLKMLALPYYSRRRYFSAFGELGFGIGEAYRSDQIGHTESISLSAGVRITKNKLFVQAGFGFEAEKAGLELNEREKIYDYGVKTFENRLSYKQVYRLNMPINFGYQIAKHAIQIGATPSYLLSTKMKYAYLENENVKRNETIFGTKTGWNSFGLKLNLGYGFNLFPSATLGLNVQIQAMKQLEISWTTSENKMPISGQVFIRKTLR
jgi:hypothetical protein